MAIGNETVATLERAAMESEGQDFLGIQLRSLLTDENRAELEPFVIAFEYLFVEQSAEEQRSRAEGAFGAAMEFDNRRVPPPIKELNERTILAWEEAAELVQHPALKARLRDLLWVRRTGERPDLNARAAAEAYLEHAERTEWSALDRADALSRALELSRSVGDAEHGEVVREAIVAFVEAELEQADGEESGPGAVMIALRSLQASNAVQADALDRLLLATEARYAGDQHVGDAVADMREQHLDADERRAIRQDQVKRWRQDAARASGLTRAVHLEHALEIARAHGLRNEQDELLRDLQALTDEDLELKEISAEIRVSTEEMEAMVNAFIDEQGGWRGSLSRFGSAGPPGGSEANLNSRVDELMRKAPIQFLVRKVVYGAEGASIFRAIDEESHRHLAVAEQRAFSARFWAHTAVPVLERIEEKQGPLVLAELTEFFTTELIPTDLAAPIARSIGLYFEGQFDEAGHMLAPPGLERAVRELARKVGLPIIRPPQGLRPGGVQTLGDLLDGLKGAFAEDAWRLYLKSLLADPLGVNLRNVIAHDLQQTAGQGEVALMIHAACFLRLLRAGSAES